MDLRQLRYFTAVARTANFKEAASRLNISQSSLSRRVADLEQYLATQLFERHPRGVVLTKQGQALLEGAERLLRDVETLRAEVSGNPGVISGDVTVGTTDVISQMLLAPLAQAFDGPLSTVRLSFVEGRQQLLFEGLEAGTIDLAVAGTLDPMPRYKMEVVLQEQICLITRFKERPRRKTLNIDDLDRIPLVLFPRPTGFRDHLDRQAQAMGIEVDCRYETSNSAAQKEFIFRGLACGVLPRSAVEADLGRTGLAATPIIGLSLNRTLVWRDDRPQTAAIEKVAQTIRELMVRHGLNPRSFDRRPQP